MPFLLIVGHLAGRVAPGQKEHNNAIHRASSVSQIGHRQWLRIRVDVHVAHWLRIRADNFYLLNDLSSRIVRTSMCHRRSCGTSTHICSLPRGAMATDTGRRTYDTSTRIRSTRAIDTGRRTSGTSAHTYSPCATDMGKQGELDLCRYLLIGIGLAVVHRCPQLLASLENSSAEL